jgi:hypothetical protein
VIFYKDGKLFDELQHGVDEKIKKWFLMRKLRNVVSFEYLVDAQ